jgi:hypothetical protein
MLRAWIVCAGCVAAYAQSPVHVGKPDGLRLLPSPDYAAPVVRILLPGRPETDRTIDVIFPEHVTARRGQEAQAGQLYLFRPGARGTRPEWRVSAESLEYERDLDGGVHFLARATLEQDGVRFHYEFTNRSGADYGMIYAVTDPRLTGEFHDVRLERTYVHHKEGFDLLASETPERLSMPLDRWLPARYLVSFTWPIPPTRVDHRDDGITYYNKSRPVDQPMIATQSTDHKWIVASFTRTVGNVWSNPELTCQHVDPETSLARGARSVTEVKVLIFPGSLDEALRKVIAQRGGLQ